MTTHGFRTHRLWPIYSAMIRRCSVKADDKDRPRYYDRGIRVCKRWRRSFSVFVMWALDNGYQHHLELDRRDRDGDYSPDNCRWVTESVQAQNRSKRSDPLTSQYKGVGFFSRRQRWRARITDAGRTRLIGYYDDEQEAAKAYDREAIELFGDNAVLNFPIKKK